MGGNERLAGESVGSQKGFFILDPGERGLEAVRGSGEFAGMEISFQLRDLGTHHSLRTGSATGVWSGPEDPAALQLSGFWKSGEKIA